MSTSPTDGPADTGRGHGSTPVEDPRPGAKPESADIAVVGIACRFPGATGPEEFWKLVAEGRRGIRELTPEQLTRAGARPERLADPALMPAAGILWDADRFDAAFFGYSPREAAAMDPQQRMFLEAAWHALEDTGHDPERFPGRVGVYAGQTVGTHRTPDGSVFLGTSADVLMAADDKDFLPTRVAYQLGLTGPAFAVQSACSTSLVAVHVACRALTAGDCDMALAGGVSWSPWRRQGYLRQPGGVWSADGHVRCFDRNASGFVSGDGLGIVALRRLADALADGDRVYAVVKGSAVNNDGADKPHYSAPGTAGQQAVIEAALRNAAVSPDTIGYVEAHGTATALGDAIEITALTRAYRAAGATGRGRCRIGSVKSNVGHTDAAAGIAGFIKAALMVRHGHIPPTPSLPFRPHPELDFATSPFVPAVTGEEWPDIAGPRRAAVSAFGVGGTNAHVVLQEPPPLPPSPPAPDWQLLALSARDERALDELAASGARALRDLPDGRFADFARTLAVGRRRLPVRRAAVFRDRAHALAEWSTRPATPRPAPVGRAGRVAFVLPGGGSQYPGMGRELYRDAPVFRETVDACLALVPDRDTARRLRAIWWPREDGTAVPAGSGAVTSGDPSPGRVVDGDAAAWPGAGVRIPRPDRGLVPAADDDTPAPSRPGPGATERYRGPVPVDDDTGAPSRPGARAGRQDDRRPASTAGGDRHPAPTVNGEHDDPRLAMPAVFITEIALARLLNAYGVTPSVLMGHSLGEYAAAHLAGVLSLEDALTLVCRRGELLSGIDNGAMLVVRATVSDVEPLLHDGVCLAVVNGPDACVLSGPAARIAAVRRHLAARGVDCSPLPLATAAHSSLVEPVLGAFRDTVRKTRLHHPAVPLISNVTGTADADFTDPEYWVTHLRHTVRFDAGLACLLDHAPRLLLETGPGTALTTLARARGAGHAVPTMRHPLEDREDREVLLTALARTWEAGVEVDLPALWPQPGPLLPAAPYPFAPTVHHPSPDRPAASPTTPGGPWYGVTWQRALEPGPVAPARDAGAYRWVLFSDGGPLSEAVRAELMADGGRVTTVLPGAGVLPEAGGLLGAGGLPGAGDLSGAGALPGAGGLPGAGDSPEAGARPGTGARPETGAQPDTDVRTITIDPRDPDQYARALAAPDEDPARPLRVISTWGGLTTASCPPLGDLTGLARALTGSAGTTELTLVTRGALDVTGAERLDPWAALTIGAAGALRAELDSVTVRVVDLDPATPPDATGHRARARALVAELARPARPEPVALRAGHRWVRRFEPLPTPPATTDGTLRDGGRYLITGGTGGVGRLLAGHLLRRHRARVVLVGRNPDAARDLAAGLAGTGGELLVRGADVAEGPQIKEVLREALHRFGGLDGVIHAAGEPGGGLTQLLTPDAVSRTLRAKTTGTLTLFDALEETGARPDFVLLFSSLAAFSTAPGLACYGAANAFLDTFARAAARTEGGPAVLAVGWDRWNGVGMGRAGERRQRALAGDGAALGGLEPAAALDAFERCPGVLALGHVVVSTVPPETVAVPDGGAETGRGGDGAQHDGAASGGPPSATGPAPSAGADDKDEADGGPLEQDLRRIWQDVLGTGTDALGRHDDFFALGGHSLAALQVVQRCRDHFGVDLSVQTVFLAPTIAGLAAELEAAGAAPAPGPGAPLTTGSPSATGAPPGSASATTAPALPGDPAATGTEHTS
ncbi:type I polyketide synthase [Streptomyces sp. NPDC003077]|uniref:type I polyketide synthase n=1 Tax=Streptomyces sp. NPDC003077 TaxID=3154443 RepID=UPI0033B04D47